MSVWSELQSRRVTRARWPAVVTALLSRVGPGALFCVLLAAGWQAMAARWQSPLIPNLSAIGVELVEIVRSGTAVQEIAVTLGRIALGMAAGFVIALVIGFSSARNRFAQSFFEPALLLGLTVPGLVWALLCVIWFGLSLKTSVVAIALGISPALAVSLTQGIAAVDPQLIEASHVFRLSVAQRMRYLWLPAILPFLLGGLRLAFSLAWKVVVLVEVFGLSTGVGYALNAAFISQNVGAVLAWTLLFALVVAAIEYGLFQVIERRLTRWQRKSNV